MSVSAAATMSRQLAGRVALVTGSTRGIGLGIARSLAADGANVVLNGFGDENQIKEIKEAIRHEHNVQVGFNGADLLDEKEIEKMMDDIKSEYGSLDIVVNNTQAGIQHVSRTELFETEMWEKVLKLNLTASFHTTRCALPKMQEQGWGRIINVASVHGLVASVEKAAYVAAKHGLIGFTKVTALENAGKGITANCICPGWVLTPLVQEQIQKKADTQGISYEQAEQNLLSEKQPSKSFVTPEQVGSMASYLCTDNAAQVTGSQMVMDGGWTAQ